MLLWVVRFSGKYAASSLSKLFPVAYICRCCLCGLLSRNGAGGVDVTALKDMVQPGEAEKKKIGAECCGEWSDMAGSSLSTANHQIPMLHTYVEAVHMDLKVMQSAVAVSWRGRRGTLTWVSASISDRCASDRCSLPGFAIGRPHRG